MSKIQPSEEALALMDATGETNMVEAEQQVLAMSADEFAKAIESTYSPTGDQWMLTPNANVKVAEPRVNQPIATPPIAIASSPSIMPRLILLGAVAAGVWFFVLKKKRRKA